MTETYLVSRQMWTRPTTWLALGLWLLMVALVVATGVMKAVGWHGAGDTANSSLVALFIAFMAFATMGALVAAHVPRNPLGWTFVTIALCAALAGVAENLAFQGLVHDPGSIPGSMFFAWLYSWLWFPTMGLIGFVVLLYPTGTVPGPRWRIVSRGLALILGLLTVVAMLHPGPLDGDNGKLPDNPVGLGALRASDNVVSPIVTGTLIVLLLATAASVVWRFWRSRGDERQQMKWMAFAAVFLALGITLPGVVGIKDTGDVFFSVAIIQLPVAVGIAMFKYRLYDVDRVINKTLVYAVSTALLAGAYIGLVLAGETLFSSVASGSSVAVAVSTLVVAGLFLPVRRRVQQFVDRRFYRRKVDVEETLARFAARLRHEADVDTLLADVHAVVGETVAPAHLHVWLREPA